MILKNDYSIADTTNVILKCCMRKERFFFFLWDQVPGLYILLNLHINYDCVKIEEICNGYSESYTACSQGMAG